MVTRTEGSGGDQDRGVRWWPGQRGQVVTRTEGSGGDQQGHS